MPDIQEILQDRGKSYGSYDAKTAFVQHLKDEMRQQPSWATMHDGGREALDMIATKIGRLLHGDPHHEDSWVDIGGYADLAAHGDIQDRKPTTGCAHNHTHTETIHRAVCDSCGEVLAEA